MPSRSTTYVDNIIGNDACRRGVVAAEKTMVSLILMRLRHRGAQRAELNN